MIKKAYFCSTNSEKYYYDIQFIFSNGSFVRSCIMQQFFKAE